MSYQVLARKWRPQRFSEVVGQEHITRTLQNAIVQKRVGHAYLFVGPRGIGKTTTARVFAKALNCDTGIVPEPCCECQSCQEIASGTSLDVIEIDGASHNKVEHIRDIRDNVQYTPSRSRHKIYIIDEVHMLSTAAWNALLKTLEEPPEHVKFFFATTEPHKVLPTIVSRCQRFDLKRISVPLIVARLSQIAASENINIEERALAAIARAADGGMRDAQSIFDQMIAFCGGEGEESINEANVIDVFGLASGAELKALCEGLLGNDLNQVIVIVQALADHGRDLERLLADLVGFVRNVMVCSVSPDPGRLLEVSESELSDYQMVSQTVDQGVVQRVLQGLVTQEWLLRTALNKRVYLEATLARVMHEAHSVQLDDVLARLNQLRQREGGIPSQDPPQDNSSGNPGAAAPPASGRPAIDTRPASRPVAPAHADAHTRERPTPRRQQDDSPAADASEHSPPPRGPAPAGEARETPAPAAAPPPPPPEQSVPNAPTVAADSPAQAVAPPPPPPEQSVPNASTDVAEGPADSPAQAVAPPDRAPQPLPAEQADLPDGGPSSVNTEAMDPPSDADTPLLLQPEPAPTSEAETSGDPARLWHLLIEEVAKIPGRQQLRTYMQELKPVSFRNGTLAIAYDEDVPEAHWQRLLDPESEHVLEQCFARVSPVPGGRVQIKRWIETVSGETAKPQLTSSSTVKKRVEQNPFVKQVCDLFEGSIIDVRG